MGLRFGWLALACAVLLPAVPAAAETIKVGYAAEPYPPFSTLDASGKWSGWEIDFTNAICEQAKLDCQIVTTAWDGIIPALTSGKIDVIIASMSINDERRKTIDFSDKYYNIPSIVIAGKGLGIKPTPEGLKDKIFGAQVSTTHEAYTRKYFEGSVAEVKVYQTQDEQYQDLAAGRIDARLADVVTGEAFLATDTGKCCENVGQVKGDPAILGLGVGVGLRKGDTALKEKINKAIADIRANGAYATFSKKYFDFDIYGD